MGAQVPFGEEREKFFHSLPKANHASGELIYLVES
jgi:hypothetical protein